jgi:hypothetical protein
MDENEKRENSRNSNEPVLRESWSDKDRYKRIQDDFSFCIIWILWCLFVIAMGIGSNKGY